MDSDHICLVYGGNPSSSLILEDTHTGEWPFSCGLPRHLFSRYTCLFLGSNFLRCDGNPWPPTTMQYSNKIRVGYHVTMWKHVRINGKLSVGNVMEPRKMVWWVCIPACDSCWSSVWTCDRLHIYLAPLW
jgi:hypothetical protein